MRYECDYGWDHLTYGGWDSGANYQNELQEALQQASSLRTGGKLIESITVRAGRESTLDDFFRVDDFVEWLEDQARDNIWWNEDSGDNVLVHSEQLEDVLRESIAVNSYTSVDSIDLKINWEKGVDCNGYIELMKGEEERLQSWINEIEVLDGR